MVEKCRYNIFLDRFLFLSFFAKHYYSQEEGIKEKGEKINHAKVIKFPFLDIYLKNQHFHFLVHSHSS